MISLDITGFISAARRNGLSLREVPAMIKKAIRKDLVEEGYEPFENDSVSDFLIRCSRNSRRFTFVIDEWDAMIREAKDDEIAQERYLDLLREWFKNNTFTPKVVAAAYMTGFFRSGKTDRSQPFRILKNIQRKNLVSMGSLSDLLKMKSQTSV